MPIAQYKRPRERVELRAAETTLARQSRPAKTQLTEGPYSEEGWQAWFVIFGLDSHKRIVSQEPVESATASR